MMAPHSEKNARERLLDAALDEFGRHGFEASTTRRIAQQAAVNIASIPYYFEGKEGLYRAVVEHVTGRIEFHVADTLREIDRKAAEKAVSPREAIDLLLKLLGGIIDLMVGSDQAMRFARIILREQLYPSSAYEIIYDRMMAPAVQAIARTLSLATGAPLTETVQLRAFSLMGQIMVFRVARESVVRMTGMQGYSPAEKDRIRSIILEQTEAAVRGLTDRPASRGHDKKLP